MENSICKICGANIKTLTTCLCKKCYNKKYHKENKAKLDVKRQKYLEKHKEELINYRKKYNQEHKQEKAIRYRNWLEKNKKNKYKKTKDWKNSNKESVSKYNKKYLPSYYQTNKDKLNIKNKLYAKAHPEQIKRTLKKYAQNNKVAFYERYLKRQRNIEIVDHVIRKVLRQMYNNKDAYTEEKLKQNFHIDHMWSSAKCRKVNKKCQHSYNNCVPTNPKTNLMKHDKLPLDFLWNNGKYHNWEK